MRKTILGSGLLTLSVFSLFLLNACTKSASNCYDAALAAAYKDRVCTMDCPGVTGCDGKTYCNASIAATQGIRVQ